MRLQGSVTTMMPGVPPLHLVLLLSCPLGAGQVPPGITPELPGGADAAFRIEAEPPQLEPARRPEEARRKYVAISSAVLPRLSSRFGRRADPFHATSAWHHGIDIPGSLGTPVLAAGAGVVRFAGSAGGYGAMVEVAHGGGLATRYAHLARILVRAGTAVEQGQPLGLMGSTGRSTGSHLHFEVRRAGSAVDPLPYLRLQTDTPLPAAAAPAPSAPHVSAFARARAEAELKGQGR